MCGVHKGKTQFSLLHMLSNASVTVLHSLLIFLSFNHCILSTILPFFSSCLIFLSLTLFSFLHKASIFTLFCSVNPFFYAKNSLLICENITRFLFFRLRKKYPFAWEFRFLCWLHPSIHSWICFHVKVCIYFLELFFFIF